MSKLERLIGENVNLDLMGIFKSAISNLHLIEMTPKVLISFVAIVSVLTLPSLIWVSCPTCHGTGYASTIPGAENLRVLRTDSKVVYHWANIACVSIAKYAFDVTVANVGSKPVHGIIEIVIIDPKTGLNLTHSLMYVEIPANITGSIFSGTITYGGSLAYFPYDLKLSAYIFLGKEVPCPSCNGRGKVPILQWPITHVYGGLKTPRPPPEVIPEMNVTEYM